MLEKVGVVTHVLRFGGLGCAVARTLPNYVIRCNVDKLVGPSR